MKHLLPLLLCCAGLTACGLAGTAAGTAAGAGAEVEQARDARQIEERVKQQVEAAQQQAAAAREQADKDTQ